jgi:hypothetical protein
LEALDNVLMYFLRGSLPLQGLHGNTRKQKYQKILETVSQTSHFLEISVDHRENSVDPWGIQVLLAMEVALIPFTQPTNGDINPHNPLTFTLLGASRS